MKLDQTKNLNCNFSFPINIWGKGTNLTRLKLDTSPDEIYPENYYVFIADLLK